jgi:hypothetical protein
MRGVVRVAVYCTCGELVPYVLGVGWVRIRRLYWENEMERGMNEKMSLATSLSLLLLLQLRRAHIETIALIYCTLHPAVPLCPNETISRPSTLRL